MTYFITTCAQRAALSIVVCAALTGCGGGSSTPRNPDTDGDSVANAQDCAPSDAAAWRFLAFQSADTDLDGHFVNTTGNFCGGAALPAKYAATPVAGSIDCNDEDNKRWQLLPHAAVDTDLDGHGIASAGEVCSGATLPAGYLGAAPAIAEQDCNDGSSSVWRFMTVYTDADGDGVGAGSGNVTCIGSSATPGISLVGYDPADDPTDPNSATISALDLSSWQLTTP